MRDIQLWFKQALHTSKNFFGNAFALSDEASMPGRPFLEEGDAWAQMPWWVEDVSWRALFSNVDITDWQAVHVYLKAYAQAIYQGWIRPMVFYWLSAIGSSTMMWVHGLFSIVPGYARTVAAPWQPDTWQDDLSWELDALYIVKRIGAWLVTQFMLSAMLLAQIVRPILALVIEPIAWLEHVLKGVWHGMMLFAGIMVYPGRIAHAVWSYDVGLGVAFVYWLIMMTRMLPLVHVAFDITSTMVGMLGGFFFGISPMVSCYILFVIATLYMGYKQYQDSKRDKGLLRPFLLNTVLPIGQEGPTVYTHLMHIMCLLIWVAVTWGFARMFAMALVQPIVASALLNIMPVLVFGWLQMGWVAATLSLSERLVLTITSVLEGLGLKQSSVEHNSVSASSRTIKQGVLHRPEQVQLDRDAVQANMDKQHRLAQHLGQSGGSESVVDDSDDDDAPQPPSTRA